MAVHYALTITAAGMQHWQAAVYRDLAARGEQVVFDTGDRPVVLATPLGGQPIMILLDPWEKEITQAIHDELTSRSQLEDTTVPRQHYWLRYIWSAPKPPPKVLHNPPVD